MNETEKMYFYFDKSRKKIWTSNELLAFKRAEIHGSDVYEISIGDLYKVNNK